MKRAVKDAQQKCSVRLFAGGALNVALLLMSPRLGVWSSVEREFRLALVASSIGAGGIVCLAPILWRGKPWQRVVALLLLASPCLTFGLVFDFVQKYR